MRWVVVFRSCALAAASAGCASQSAPGTRPNHPYLEALGWYGVGNSTTAVVRASAGYVGRVCTALGEYDLRGGALIESGSRSYSGGNNSYSSTGAEIEADGDLSPDLRIGPRVSVALPLAPETGFVATAGVHLRTDHFDFGAELMHDTGRGTAPSATEVALAGGVSTNSVAGVVVGVLASALAVGIAASVLGHDN
ncbi:MAG: hypothetical protein JO257_38310 [Deltaproteobacteria bacterium]|nr:hypothetical protein [Deltaproteobacteria bacterium]